MKYRTIVVDPPWLYEDKLSMGSGPPVRGGAAAHYGCLTMADMLRLPVADIAAPDAHLYLWTTNAFLVEAHELAAAWGFRPRTMLTWVKTQIGMGHYFRNNTEHVLFCVRGRLPLLRKDIPTAFTAPRGRHSAKPQAFFDLVESASPGPFIEIFGRGMARMGWTALGDQVGDGGDIRDALARLREAAA